MLDRLFVERTLSRDLIRINTTELCIQEEQHSCGSIKKSHFPLLIYRLPSTAQHELSLTHESSRIGNICADFAIDLDKPLHAYFLDLITSQGVLKPIPEKNDKWEAFPQFVGSC